MSTPRIEWLQVPTEQHLQGMRLECECGYIEYFGDSPAGDLRMAEAKKAHRCKTEDIRPVGDPVVGTGGPRLSVSALIDAAVEAARDLRE